jgi:hypothetical protein
MQQVKQLQQQQRHRGVLGLWVRQQQQQVQQEEG